MMDNNLMIVIDILLFGYIIAALVNPALWIQKVELKNDPKEQAKMRKIAVVLLIIEIIFCLLEYVIF